MTPGLAGPPFPAKAKKGAIVTVASLENPSVPVAVGTCEIDVSALQRVQGAKGHAVGTFHWAGDEIWSWSTSGKPGKDPPEEIEGWDVQEDDAGEVAEGLKNLDLDEDAGGGVSLTAVEEIELPVERAEGVDGEEPAETEAEPEKELTTKGGRSSRCVDIVYIDMKQTLTRPSEQLFSMGSIITSTRTEMHPTSASNFL